MAELDDFLGKVSDTYVGGAKEHALLRDGRYQASSVNSLKRNGVEERVQLELPLAQRTLSRSFDVANRFIGFGYTAKGAPSMHIPTDNRFWFAKIYEIITRGEIELCKKPPRSGRGPVNCAQDLDGFIDPAFVLHFIPVFFEMYYEAITESWRSLLEKDRNRVGKWWLEHPWWKEHFDLADWLAEQDVSGSLDQIVQCIRSGIEAHIRGDMAIALIMAYKSYSRKYPLLEDAFMDHDWDFFEVNDCAFRRVPGTFFKSKEFVSFVSPYSVERTQFVLGLGNELLPGVPISEINEWRREAWRTAETIRPLRR